MDAHLQAFLAERDEPCPGCSYNLRGLASATCPECRQALHLRVNLVEPAIASWVATLIGLAVPGGAAAFELAGVLWILGNKAGRMSSRELAPLIVMPAVILIVHAALTLCISSRRGRVWFRSIPAARRTALAVGSWGVGVGWFVLWLSWVLRH